MLGLESGNSARVRERETRRGRERREDSLARFAFSRKRKRRLMNPKSIIGEREGRHNKTPKGSEEIALLQKKRRETRERKLQRVEEEQKRNRKETRIQNHSSS